MKKPFAGPIQNQARDPRSPIGRLTATVLLTMILLASSSLAGISWSDETEGPQPGPGGADIPETSGSGDVGVPEDQAWWPEWLDHFDKDGNGVDDRADRTAMEHVLSGRPLEPVSVLLTYEHPPTEADRDRLIEAYGADPDTLDLLAVAPTILATFHAVRVFNLGDVPGVVAVEWDYPLDRVLTISAPSTQAREYAGTGSNTVYNGATAEALGYTGDSSVVAVLDTGISPTHPAFAGKIVATVDSSTIGNVECTVSHDVDGHGTHVASTAIGNPAGNSHKGTAKDANVVDVQISKQLITIGGILRGFNWVFSYNQAIDAGSPKCGVDPDDRIDVATVSFGSTDRGGPNAGTTETAINNLVSQGVVVTIAVGNCGPQPSALCDFGDVENGISSPGNAANAIGVAASGDANTVDRGNDPIARFSSRGPNSAQANTGNTNPGAAGGANDASDLDDRYRKPDITAAGVSIRAANYLHTVGSDYIFLSGTSMSTPHVAGISALLMDVGEQVKSQTGGTNLMRPTGTSFSSGDYVIGPNPVRDAIIFSADYRTSNVPSSMLTKWEGPNALGATWNNAWGYGSIDAFTAVCWAWEHVLEPGGATTPAGVSNECPSTALTVDAGGPYEEDAGETISFSSQVTGGSIPFSYDWDFGDGNSSTDPDPNHAYEQSGEYTVTLTVTDDESTAVTDQTTATISEPDPAPSEPVVEIVDPDDGSTVSGVTTIQGTAGHTDGTTTQGLDSQQNTETTGSVDLPGATVQNGGLVLDPGENTLWLRGEREEGVGMPDVQGQNNASLSPEEPDGTVPVVHTASGALAPIVFTSAPLDDEVHLDPNGAASLELHYQAWSDMLPVFKGTFEAELRAVAQDGTISDLTSGSADNPAWGFAHVQPSTITIPLDQWAEEDEADLGIDQNARLELQIQLSADPPVADALFSLLYDAEGFASRLDVPVSLQIGGPDVTTFSAGPASGTVPLAVSFDGTVTTGDAAIDRVEIDPGDGSGVITATVSQGSFEADHTYQDVGDWTATATAFDVDGRFGTADTLVSVSLNQTERVHVTIGDGEPENAQDTSQDGDWSTWSLDHDFGAYEDGTVLDVTAVYFNGTTESDPHTVSVTVGSNNDGGTAEPQTQANVTIEAPAEGSQVLPDFQANGTAVVEEAGSEQESGTEATIQSQSDSYPDLDREALDLLEGDLLASLDRDLSDLPGYIGVAPALDGERVVYAQFDGPAPVALPAVNLPGGWSLKAIEVVLKQAALNGVETIHVAQDERTGPPLPEQATGIGPGSRIHISGVPRAGGTVACTANFVWEDQSGNLYLGAAGHCFMPDGTTSTHPPNADYTVPDNLIVAACVASCAFGGQSGFQFTGQFVALGDVVYARQSGAGSDQANDFGLVRIPDKHRDLVRPEMPVWDGPHREQNPSFGSLLVHYGNGVVVGEVWPTMGRAGVVTSANANTWLGLHPSTFGDSGSAISLGVVHPDTRVITGEAATGIITHLSCCPGTAGGPTISRVQTLAQESGLDIELVTQGSDTGPFAPGSPQDVSATPGDQHVELSWSEPSSDGGAPIQEYTVYWGATEGGPYPDSQSTSSRNATVTGLVNNETYYFVVTATNEVGESPASDEQSATPVEAPPFVVEVRLSNETAVVVNWTVVDEYDGSSWSHGFADTPIGSALLEARLLEHGSPIAQDNVTFNVEQPPLPEFDPIENQTVIEGEELRFNVSASHPEGNSLSLSVDPLPEGATFTDHGNGTGEFTWIPTEQQAGHHKVTFTASDGEVSADETATIIVGTLEPFATITGPEDGDSLTGVQEIRGTAGHVVNTTDPAGNDDEGGESTEGNVGEEASLGHFANDLEEKGQLHLDPGLHNLWIRGEGEEGIGFPTFADLHQSRLSPQPPDGAAPVVHSGSGAQQPIVFTSAPLATPVVLDADGEAAVELHYQAWSDALPVFKGTFKADLQEVAPDGTTTVLASGTSENSAWGFAYAQPSTIFIPLGDWSGEDPEVPEGHRLQMVTQMTSDLPVADRVFSLLYDAEGFASHVRVPVSPKTGAPEIISFSADPTSGDLPLDVTFNGAVETGFDELDRVVFDPGDGTPSFEIALANGTFEVTHVYEAQGAWKAMVTAVDVENRNGSKTLLVDVGIQEGVYVTVNDGVLERAFDVSEEQDWSSWNQSHDFSQYPVGSNVSIEAFYFNGEQLSATHEIMVVVGGEADDIEARISGPEQVWTGENSTFNGTGSRGDIVEWQWDFDDGTTASGQVVEHSWDWPGPKNLTLTVRDAAQREDMTTHRVTVQGGPRTQV